MADEKRREVSMDILNEWKLTNQKFDWMEEAMCKGLTHMFFPEQGDENKFVERAKAICATCTVKDDCLEFALDNSFIYGIWGGMSSRQRKTYKSELRRKGRK
jgi:WhiB family redox-sensing transcriptional regulator